ncbi:CRISPR-associated endonuclease Cas3'' [Natronobiforma cellulositropha]|uniref:CRISPR-associated endonuclease Cas3'' n=1 Tax=Natronobiforma cellulositropha TaxID=1679076 RepID=UPI0021D5F83A|nr:CRISPR-associated endonuclease Cas3'' [Natronobiforma cellulositropha]
MPVRYSHPPEDGHDGVMLFEHLEDVAKRSGYIVPSEAQTPAGESLQSVIETLGFAHDFGKATTYFQQHIGVEAGSPPKDRFRHHAPISSFVAYYALEARGFEPETCLAGFVAVAKHHGRLPDVSTYVFKRTDFTEGVEETRREREEKQLLAIAQQIADIDESVPQLADDILREASAGNSSWREFVEGFGALRETIQSNVTVRTDDGESVSTRETLSDAFYSLVLECWGALVFADKTSAAQARDDVETSADQYAAIPPSLERLNEYVDDLERKADADEHGTRAQRLNYYRAQARKSVLENAETFADTGGVATLTLPTGMGKTLSGLSAANTVRIQRDGERIIYALPFTSIIDQVVDDIETIYEADTAGRLLSAHHHLSETAIRDESDEDADDADRNDDVAGMLGTGWRAGITVTTFVQLFESLAGSSNAQSMKIPALRNSVVVLDEPQSLPLEWWKLVPRLTKLLTERYGATVIAMTATQPRLFDDAVELVEDSHTYFEATERIEYELDESVIGYITDRDGAKSHDDAARTLFETVDSDESALAICNTIDSAKTLTKLVSESRPGLVSVGEVYGEVLETAGEPDEVDATTVADRVVENGDCALLHLSTRLRPADRLRLIETAKELTKGGHTLVAISTQLVEAGVDISFDTVYRDLAPIDSIVQAAGRCNRSFERERGRVTVWWLDVPEEQQKTPAEAVYNRGVRLLPATVRALEEVRGGSRTLSETAVSQTAVERYYSQLHEEKNVGRDEYATYVDESRGDKLAALSLINQRNTFEVAILRTETEKELPREIETAVDQYEFKRTNALLRELRATQVSVPIYRTDSREARKLASLNPIHGESEIRWIDPSSPEFGKFFDATTGFVVPDSTVERRFL